MSARLVPYFTPVPLALLRVAHPFTALESLTVSATGPLLISSDDADWVALVVADDPVCGIELLLDALESVCPELLPYAVDPAWVFAALAVPEFAAESDCGNPLSNPLLPACAPELLLFSLGVAVEPFCADVPLLEVVDPFFDEALLEVALLEFVCANATAPMSRAVPRTETIIFMTESLLHPNFRVAQSWMRPEHSGRSAEICRFPIYSDSYGPVGGACPVKSNMSNISPEAAFRAFRLGSAQFHCTSFNTDTWSITA